MKPTLFRTIFLWAALSIGGTPFSFAADADIKTAVNFADGGRGVVYQDGEVMCFTPNDAPVMNSDCMNKINERIKQEEAEAKRQREEEARWQRLLNATPAQEMYMAAGALEREGSKGRAKTVYEQLIKRFSSSPFALKANDRLLQLQDVDAYESAASRVASEQARTRRAAEESRQGYCSGKNSCFSSCSGLRGDAGTRCWSSCNSQYSGC